MLVLTLCDSTLVAEEDRGVIGYRIFFFSKPAKSSLQMMKNRSLSILFYIIIFYNNLIE